MNEIQKAAIFFRDNLQNKIFIVRTKYGDMKIIVDVRNFKHLLIGKTHIDNSYFDLMKPELFYSNAIRGKIKNDDLLLVCRNEEIIENVMIKNRIHYFYKIKELLGDGIKLIIDYNPRLGNSLVKTDYISFSKDDVNYYFLGFRKDKLTCDFVFNTFMVHNVNRTDTYLNHQKTIEARIETYDKKNFDINSIAFEPLKKTPAKPKNYLINTKISA